VLAQKIYIDVGIIVSKMYSIEKNGRSYYSFHDDTHYGIAALLYSLLYGKYPSSAVTVAASAADMEIS